MKTRRHHNNDGRRQIKNGSTRAFAKRLARSLGVPVARSVTNTGEVDGPKAEMPNRNRAASLSVLRDRPNRTAESENDEP